MQYMSTQWIEETLCLLWYSQHILDANNLCPYRKTGLQKKFVFQYATVQICDSTTIPNLYKSALTTTKMT